MPSRPRKGSAKPNASGRKKRRNGRRSSSKLFAFTIDSNTARVVSVEALDASGARHEVSEAEKASFARKKSEPLEQALQEAFEAGIDCVLGGDEDQGETESQQDVEIRKVLLSPLIKRSSAKRLLDRAVLDRAILDTLFEHSMNSKQARNSPARTSPAESSPSASA